MRRGRILSVFFLALCLCLANDVLAMDFPIGTVVEDFKLKDTEGKEKSFNDLKGEKGTIVVFLSIQCPIVKAYDERINAIAADYKAKGINFVGINSNSTEVLEEVKSHAAEKYDFPVLIDAGNVIADKFGAQFTPEMFFFDASNKLIYHGAIDNDRSGQNIKANYLRAAMDESLSGKSISMPQTKAFGCSIKRKS